MSALVQALARAKVASGVLQHPDPAAPAWLAALWLAELDQALAAVEAHPRAPQLEEAA